MIIMNIQITLAMAKMQQFKFQVLDNNWLITNGTGRSGRNGPVW